MTHTWFLVDPIGRMSYNYLYLCCSKDRRPNKHTWFSVDPIGGQFCLKDRRPNNAAGTTAMNKPCNAERSVLHRLSDRFSTSVGNRYCENCPSDLEKTKDSTIISSYERFLLCPQQWLSTCCTDDFRLIQLEVMSCNLTHFVHRTNDRKTWLGLQFDESQGRNRVMQKICGLLKCCFWTGFPIGFGPASHTVFAKFVTNGDKCGQVS